MWYSSTADSEGSVFIPMLGLYCLQVVGSSLLIGMCILIFNGVCYTLFSPAFNLATNGRPFLSCQLPAHIPRQLAPPKCSTSGLYTTQRCMQEGAACHRPPCKQYCDPCAVPAPSCQGVSMRMYPATAS